VKGSGKVFDIEVQTTDTKELPERARYYQGVIDVDCLSAGQPYKELKDSYIIFICIHDIFGKGLPLYTFENMCRQDTTLPLGDRTLKYFFISKNSDKLMNEEQKAFMRLIGGERSTDAFTEKIVRLAEDVKRSAENRRLFMEWERQKAYEFYRGKEAGRQEAARKLLQMNVLSFEQIADALSISLEDVKDLAEETPVLVKSSDIS